MDVPGKEIPDHTKKGKPVKRHQYLQEVSRDHHHSLLLCWKIRTGFSKGVPIERMSQYVTWFFKEYIKVHFKAEEAYIFPILGMDHELVKKAMADHRRLRRLFADKTDLVRSISLIEEELEQHIRFEERVLFNEVQQVATPEQLKVVHEKHSAQSFRENTADEFWKA